MDAEQPVIELQNVSKVFHLYKERHTNLKAYLFNLYKKNPRDELWALKNINMAVDKGEFISIIGPNGGGKTTLLRIISKVYQPTSGKITVRGTIAPFVDLSTGFQWDLNVRDNVYLYGATLGLTKREVDKRFNNIISFSELQKHVDRKINNFSHGMTTRLAFSISTYMDADIFLVDEALSVGDLDFQKKCLRLFWNFKSQGKTILFVTHDLDIANKFSNRVLLIDDGKVVVDGTPKNTISRYKELIHHKASNTPAYI